LADGSLYGFGVAKFWLGNIEAFGTWITIIVCSVVRWQALQASVMLQVAETWDRMASFEQKKKDQPSN
jgi:hypothetical protein